MPTDPRFQGAASHRTRPHGHDRRQAAPHRSGTQEHLHRFIALDYHRSPHDGIRLPGLEAGHFTPLERYDMLLPAVGNIVVPQRPRSYDQVPPKRWLKSATPASSTVADLRRDSLHETPPTQAALSEPATTGCPSSTTTGKGQHLRHRHPFTDRVHQLEWRESHLLHAPLTDVVIDEARRLLRERGEDASKRKVMLELIDELTQLTAATDMDEWC